METAVPPQGVFSRALRGIKNAMPEGRALPDEVWDRRHAGIRVLLLTQAIGLAIFGFVRGYPFAEVFSETAIIAATAAIAGWHTRGRKFRAGVATFGLVSCSAVLVQFSGGTIEAHFHFFAMVAVITLYQDWTPFLLAIGFTVLHHGTAGVLNPRSVYNHDAAIRNPWIWALIHGLFVLFAAVANVVAWRLNERAREHSEIAERETRHALGLVAGTLESTADGILVVDGDGKITHFNRKFIEMWNIPDDVVASGSDDAALGFVIDQLADPDGFLVKVRELYSKPEAESFDELVFKDGRVFERYSQPQRVGGVSVGRVWSFRDVTERNKLDDMKNGFLSAVSHELRTPLTSVIGYAVTLQRMEGTLGAEERVEVLDRLTASALRLQRLLADTIDLDRLSRGILEPNRLPTDVPALVRRVVTESEALAGNDIEIDDDPASLMLDTAKIERIVENLLTNASKHAGSGKIRVAVRSRKGAVEIHVEDRGPGVPDDLKEAIFKAFRQGPTASRHSPGVGIGLALVARFAELHGGHAWVEDRPGGGSSFRVVLPGRDAPAVTTPPPRRSSSTSAA